MKAALFADFIVVVVVACGFEVCLPACLITQVTLMGLLNLALDSALSRMMQF